MLNFDENPSHGSRIVSCGRTDRHMTKLVVAFFFAILRTRLDTGDKPTGYGNLRVNDMLCVTAGGNKLPPFSY